MKEKLNNKKELNFMVEMNYLKLFLFIGLILALSGCLDSSIPVSVSTGTTGSTNNGSIFSYLTSITNQKVFNWKNVDTNRLVIYYDGNVGINKETPGHQLDVNGDINALRLCINEDCRTSWPNGGSTTDTTLDTNQQARESFLRNDMNYSGAIDFNGRLKARDVNIDQNLQVRFDINARRICILGDCRTVWPVGSGGVDSIVDGRNTDSNSNTGSVTIDVDLNHLTNQSRFDSNFNKEWDTNFKSYFDSNFQTPFDRNFNLTIFGRMPLLDGNISDSISVDWTGLQSYPTGCGANTAVGTIGDTLTCVAALSSWPDLNGYMTKASFDGNFQTAYDSNMNLFKASNRNESGIVDFNNFLRSDGNVDFNNAKELSIPVGTGSDAYRDRNGNVYYNVADGEIYFFDVNSGFWLSTSKNLYTCSWNGTAAVETFCATNGTTMTSGVSGNGWLIPYRAMITWVTVTSAGTALTDQNIFIYFDAGRNDINFGTTMTATEFSTRANFNSTKGKRISISSNKSISGTLITIETRRMSTV